MLSIRDEQVRTLAQDVMRKTGAPTITAAIRLALENEIARREEKMSLRERVEALRRKVLGDVDIVPDRNTIDSRDDLWDR
jgi:antitoxin VapB